MYIINDFYSRKWTMGKSIQISMFILFLVTAFPSYGADLPVEYSIVARSGETAIPTGVGTFTGFGGAPAIDADGNIVFTGAGGVDNNGKTQAGVFTSVGVCCQKVADKNTAVPGGGGQTFTLFSGADRNDIDGGRVAFTASISNVELLYGLYSNVGQANSNSLYEVALVDGDNCSE